MCFYCFSSVSCDLSERQQGNLYIFWLLNQVRRLVSIWVLPASRWAVPDIHTPYWCSLHQASDCCRYFPSFTGTVTIGLLSICPRITSLKFLSCSPCAVPPFELHSGGAVVLIIASLMSWFSNPKFRGINPKDILWRFSNTSACFLYSCREFQGQGWYQPREIEVSILYRNAVWALQAGKFKGSIGFNHYTRKWGFWKKSDLY